MLIPIVAATVGLLLAFAVTPASARLAHRFGILDRPDAHLGGKKAHERTTPYLGGLAIACGVLGGFALITVHPDAPDLDWNAGLPLAVLLAAGLGTVGMLDDIRSLHPGIRFLAQGVAAVLAIAGGFQVSATPFDLLNLVITLVWIVGITNAFNLLDNMDGLSAGLAGVSALSFAAMGVIGGMPTLATLAGAIAGGALGFLAHNRHPARVFMGDAGSLFLGFLLALIGLKLRFDNLVTVTFLVPVVVLGIPILDTTLTVASRIRHGRSPFQGGRDHVSHRLVGSGLSVRAAVGVLYWAGLCLGWLGLAITQATPEVGFMLLGLVVAIGAFYGAVLWRVDVYSETLRVAPSEEPIDPDEVVERSQASP